jgi:hypothetical protein
MSREVTNSEGLLGGIIMVLLAVVVLMSGCATTPHRFAKMYDVGPYKMCVMERYDIRAKYLRDYGIDVPRIGGYFDETNRILYVDCGEGDQPNFEHSGHEQWHLPELGGRFHK